MSKIIRVLAKTKINVVETKGDKEKGIVEAIVSVFNNIDLGGDKIIKGAFKESLKKKLPKGVWMHFWDVPIAKTIQAKETDEGLYIKGQFNLDTQRGKEAFSDLKFGLIDEFSIGYRVLDDEYDEDGTRILKKLKLYEWSPVLAGMNPKTRMISAKADNEEQPKNEPKKEVVKKINYIDVDPKKVRVKIYYSDGTVERYERKRLSFKYKTHLKALAVKEPEKGQKVEGEQATLLKLVKRVNKDSSTFLRIVKKSN